MKPISILSHPLGGHVHFVSGERALIVALESVYAENEVPCGNRFLAGQRAYRNASVWDNWFYGCPQVQARLGGEKVIFFDDRVVDVDHLEAHPLLSPSFLRDHWNEMRGGALAVPQAYVSALVELSHTSDSGVRAVRHADLGTVNTSFMLDTGSVHPYFKAFVGLSAAERALYIEAHRAKHGKNISLWCALNDAEQEAAMGRLAVFYDGDSLGGGNDLKGEVARLLGVRRSVASAASLSAEGAEHKTLEKALLAAFPHLDPERLKGILSQH